MPIRLHTQENELSHVEVSPDTWFYMNHVYHHEAASAHDHDYVELVFVLSGAARHLTVRGEVDCRSGDVLLIPRG
ncbi:MAG: AraC family ligand binding domain-containing protein, partial [Puniceicoccales bacterium]